MDGGLVMYLPRVVVDSRGATSGDDVDSLFIGVAWSTICDSGESTWPFGLE